MTRNHQENDHKPQTTTNDQIDLSRIQIISFFCKLEMRQSLTDVNKHRHLNSLRNFRYIPYATYDILVYLFF